MRRERGMELAEALDHTGRTERPPMIQGFVGGGACLVEIAGKQMALGQARQIVHTVAYLGRRVPVEALKRVGERRSCLHLSASAMRGRYTASGSVSPRSQRVYAKAAAELGMTYPAYRSALHRARAKAYHLWFSPETPPRKWGTDRPVTHAQARDYLTTYAVRRRKLKRERRQR